jgi:hypothetical protein
MKPDQLFTGRSYAPQEIDGEISKEEIDQLAASIQAITDIQTGGSHGAIKLDATLAEEVEVKESKIGAMAPRSRWRVMKTKRVRWSLSGHSASFAGG